MPCDQCGKRIDVPTIAGLAGLDFVDDDPEKQLLPVSRRWTPLRGFLAATFFTLALIGLGRAGLYSVYRLSHPTDYTIEDFLQAIDAETESMSPAESWDDWRYLQESGLGKKSPPALLVQKRILEKRDAQMIGWGLAGGVASVGFLIATFFRGKKEALPGRK